MFLLFCACFAKWDMSYLHTFAGRDLYDLPGDLHMFRQVASVWAIDIVHNVSIIYIRAPHGCRHSPAPMLRVGQGSTSTCSIQYSTGSKNRYHTTHSLRV